MGKLITPMSLAYSVSPHHSSPLSHPPYQPPSRSPSPPQNDTDIYPSYPNPNFGSGRSTPMPMPIPVPTTPRAQTRALTLPPLDERRQRHPSSIPSPSDSASLDGPILLAPQPSRISPSTFTNFSKASPSQSQGARKTSTSLAGSYTLSLLSSRMSTTHPPHSIESAFTLQIGSTSSGKDIPSRLKCPPHEKIGFDARWHDLEGGQQDGTPTMTPWVGTVDVEGHYYQRFQAGNGNGYNTGTRAEGGNPKWRTVFDGQGYGNLGIVGNSSNSRGRKRLQSPSRIPRGQEPSIERGRRPASPPPFPGYELGSRGLLQLVVKNEFHALKVFLINYDLNVLEPGGKMLVRERGYQVYNIPPVSREMRRRSMTTGTSPGGSGSGGKKEILRFAVELQFTCVDARAVRQKRRKDRMMMKDVGFQLERDVNQTIQPRKRESHRPPSSSIPLFDEMTTTTMSDQPVKKRKKDPEPTKAYFLSKPIRIVFPALSGGPSVSSSPTPKSMSTDTIPTTDKPEIRTERFIEVINPEVISEGMSMAELKRARRRSFASDTWEGVKDKWRQRMTEEEEEAMNEPSWRSDGRDDDVFTPEVTPEPEFAGHEAEDGDLDEDSIRRSGVKSIRSKHVPVQSLFNKQDSDETMFERSKTPIPQLKGSSLLTARLDEYGALPFLDQNHAGKNDSLKNVTLPISGMRPQSPVTGWQKMRGDDENERLLSESLKRLPFKR